MLKYIVYDKYQIDSEILISELNRLCNSVIYRISDNQLLVNYNGTSENLYNNLIQIIQDHRILIFDINQNAYFGYHDKRLWEWMKRQFDSDKH